MDALRGGRAFDILPKTKKHKPRRALADKAPVETI